jgi:hypothetical protein
VAATNASEPQAAHLRAGRRSRRRGTRCRQTAPHNDEPRRSLRRFESAAAAAVDHGGDAGSRCLFVPSGGVRRLQSRCALSAAGRPRRGLRRPPRPRRAITRDARPRSDSSDGHSDGHGPSDGHSDGYSGSRRTGADQLAGAAAYGLVIAARVVPVRRANPALSPRRPAACAGRAHCRARCLIRAVSSWTCSKVLRRCAISLRIFLSACMTVVWSRPPNVWPMRGSERSVSSRHRYMAI